MTGDRTLTLLGVEGPLPPEVRGVRPPSARPPDFAAFWSATRADLDRTDPDVRLRRLAVDAAGLVLTDATFTSLGAARITGYLLRWPDGRPRPLIVHGHGYGGQNRVRWDWAQTGCHVFGVDIRGFGRSSAALPERSRHGWILTGIAAPETSVLRGAGCDYLRAAEVAIAALGEQRSTTVLTGTSFAGALTVMAEAQRPTANLLALGVPTFGWAEGRRLLVQAGSGLEITRYLAATPRESEEDVLRVLRYFDTMHHAPLVHAPAIVGVGQVDAVVPAPTVYAVVNALSGPVEVWELPVSHTELPAESWWQRFEEHCLERAVASDQPSG